MPFEDLIQDLLRRSSHAVVLNPPRRQMIRDSIDRREAIPSRNGALVTWTAPDSTGRSPKDTVTVQHPASADTIDWSSPNNVAITPQTFDMLMEDALRVLGQKDRLYVLDRVVGADSRYALPIRLVTDRALTSLFADNMFRPSPSDIDRSVFADRPFLLLALPFDRLSPERYQGRLRVDPKTRKTTTMAVAMDYDRRVGLVYGSAYCGSVKKLIFTVMNYYLPAEGILPLHCSANEGVDGDIALLLGLSGTGKTTLSAEPDRRLLGDDEHGWSEDGVANFENGCYAKLIHLDPTREPEIHHAVCHDALPEDHGAIVENAMMFPDGTFDFSDDRYTPNSRASYLLSCLPNIKTPPVGGHPKSILFLTADANGVLPPVARLNREQAMLWFLMGYTSKLAGTETGVVEPVSTFSRFFGEPFMPRLPSVYAEMLGQKMDRHGARVFLVNTGWSGGPYGVGSRMDILLTRRIVRAILSGALDHVEYDDDPLFHLSIPRTCPGVEDSTILNPRHVWSDQDAFQARAQKLAAQFAAHFDRVYGPRCLDPRVVASCPGK